MPKLRALILRKHLPQFLGWSPLGSYCPLHATWNLNYIKCTLRVTYIPKGSIYVKQSEGFVDPHFSNYVYWLKKAFYGLKQVLRAWYARLTRFLLDHHFDRGSADKSSLSRNKMITYYSINLCWRHHFWVDMWGDVPQFCPNNEV